MKYEITTFKTPTFEAGDGRSLVLFRVGADWGCKARELGRLLKYTNDGKKLVANITERWNDEFIEGVDFVNEVHQVPTLGGPPARPEMVLTRTGINLVCLKTRQPVGQQIRRWLAGEVLPQIADTGSYGTPAALDPQVLATAIGSAVSAALAPLVERITRLETPRRGPLPGGTGRGGGGGPVDVRRSALTGLDQLSVRAAANVLGVSRDTVRRWRADEEEAPPTPEPAPLPSHPVLSETQAFLETIAWVQRNESSFYRPLCGTPPPGGWVGKIDDKHVVILRTPLVRILGYRFQHIIREWARRGWLRLESKGDGRFRPDKAFKLAGKRHRGYHIPIDYLRR